jgi:RNA polymerase sigma-70 factor (ECF subfamily)
MCHGFEFENEYGFDAEVTRVLRIKARQAAERAGFLADEIQDLEQELATELHAALPRYREAKGKKTTFAARVIERRLIKIVAERDAQKRGGGQRPSSLNEVLGASDGDEIELIDLLDCESVLRRTGRLTRPLQEQIDMGIDLRESLERLPDQLREVADKLERLNPSEISRDTDIPRASVYDAMHKVRERFLKDGIEAYR